MMSKSFAIGVEVVLLGMIAWMTAIIVGLGAEDVLLGIGAFMMVGMAMIWYSVLKNIWDERRSKENGQWVRGY
jgi:hypothetical protein